MRVASKISTGMLSVPPQITQMKTEFERARRWRRAYQEPLQLGDVRISALDRFLSLGFPTTRDQEWRFTNIAQVTEKMYTLPFPSPRDANHAGVASMPRSEDFGTELIFVNGFCLRDESKFGVLPDGVRAGSLLEILASKPNDVTSHLARIAPFESRPFVAINTALFTDGAYVLIPAHTVLETSIHLRFISTGEADMRPALSNPRVLIVLDNFSKATIVESYIGPAGVQYFTNAVTEIVLGENAVLNHYKLQCESTEAYCIDATQTVVGSGANYAGHFISLGGAIVRNEVVATLGQGAECGLNGICFADRDRLIDHHCAVNHSKHDSRSNQHYSGILSDGARSVFDGKVNISAEADRAEARQVARTLMLSKDSVMNCSTHAENLGRKARCIQRTSVRHIDEDRNEKSCGTKKVEPRHPTLNRFVCHMVNNLLFEPLACAVAEAMEQRIRDVLATDEIGH